MHVSTNITKAIWQSHSNYLVKVIMLQIKANRLKQRKQQFYRRLAWQAPVAMIVLSIDYK